MTVNEFERLYLSPEDGNRLLELIDGEVCEKWPTQEHGLIALNIGAALGSYGKVHKAGRTGFQVRHQLAGDGYNSRLPDVSFSTARHPLLKEGSVPYLPALAVEIKLPDDTIIAMRKTAAYYLANGSRLVWLVYPRYRLVEVYRPDADVEMLREKDTLAGGDVLPGFELPVWEVFADPLAE